MEYLKSVAIQDEINNKKAAIEQEKLNGQQANYEQIKQWENEINILEMQLSDEKALEANHQRVQVQTEKVESITLPLDFNDLLDNPLANEMIIEVVKQFQRQAYEEHNAELFRVSTEWNQKVVALSNFAKETNDALKAENDSLQHRLADENEQAQMDAVEILELTQQVAQLGIDKKDADSKRDAALRELSDAHATIESQQQAAIENVELKAQIEALQQELISKKAFTVNGNDKLAELASRAKESTIEKVNRGLARWNLPAIEVPSTPEHIAPLEIPALQEVHTHTPQESTNHDVHSGGTQATEGNQPLDEVVDKATEETTVTLQSLKAELDELKSAHEVTASIVAKIKEHANLPLSA